EPTMAQRGPPAPLGSGPTMALREVALESQSTLLGRDADVAAVERTLLAEGRIVTVTGAPGIGKSTLVGHVASRARDRGVRVTSVQVGPTATIEELEGALAVALRRGAGTTWLEQLALEDGLIVIDGGEASGEELGRRLPAWSSRAPSARWLLARRNELSVPEEDVVCLGPLPRVAARELFSARARRAKGTSVVVDADELAAIDAIIDVVGASPLALCLAASRTNLLSPREIATRLTAGTDDERLALLHDRKAPRAAASLRDAISWSFAILDPLHARVLARLSVFESPFDVESATQVVCVAGEPIDPMSVLETIEAARGASLVRSLADASSRARVALEPNVRAYARGRLRDDAAASAVETAFVELMARRARAAVTSPASSPERTAHLLADDAGSLRAAHRLGRGREELASEAAWIATALLGRGPDPSIEQSLEEFLADPRRPSLELAVHAGVVILHRLGERDVVAAASRASSLVAQASEGRDPGLLALARVAYFDALVRVSRLGDAAHVAAELRASALAAGDLAAEIDANAKLGVIAWRRSQPDDALESLRRALVLAESLHDRSRQANVLLSLGILCVQIRRFDEARAFYERGRELARAEHLHRLVATFANNLGVVHHEEDRLELAQSCFDEASEQARAAGLAVLFAVSRGNVGMVHHEAGRATDARLALDAAIALLTTLGDTRYRVIFLGARAALFADQSEPEAAALDIATAASLLERALEPQLALALSIRSAHVELASGRSTPAHAERARAEAAAHLTEGNTSNSVAARSEVVRMALRALARRIARG
ncbi:MAG: tetratricopeptide repeat protein, partial [Sandaracinaceae bacterium]|nr:tetratricopeptide repeat protein [Sandaracinaceae bacterium]